MDNQTNQFFTEDEHRQNQHQSDYHDGENDQHSPKQDESEEQNDDGDEEDYGKSHSGL